MPRPKFTSAIDASTSAPKAPATIASPAADTATALAVSAPLPPKVRTSRISPVAPEIFSTKASVSPADRAGPSEPVNSPTAQRSPAFGSSAMARQADSPSPVSREVQISLPSGAIASPSGRTAPIPRIQLTRPAASARNTKAPAVSSRADPARSCVPEAVPASAIPPASSAARALGTACPTSGRTSQGGSADPLGEGRDDEQAHSAATARAGKTRMSPQSAGDKADPHFPIRRSDFWDDFQKRFPEVSLQRGLRYVRSDPVIFTAGGLTSGIDLALHVVELYFGREVAARTAKYMEYEGKGWLRDAG